jgi:transposase-like protein
MAMRGHGVPVTITADRSGANAAAIERCNAAYQVTIATRQGTYLDNRMEPDHRAIKQVTQPLLGFNACWTAQPTLAWIALMHMIKKGQRAHGGQPVRPPAGQCDALAA